MASSLFKGGRIEGSARARIVLPVPGGPVIKRLCPPEAAIVSALLAASCPRMSARSCFVSADLKSISVLGKGSSVLIPERCSNILVRFSVSKTFKPSIIAASRPLPKGTKISLKPSLLAFLASAKTPFMGRRPPSSESSPKNILPSVSNRACLEAST